MAEHRPVAALTFATGFVGPSLAKLLAEEGFDLALHAPEGAAEQVAELEALGASVATIGDVDLTSAEGNQAFVDAALERFGRLDAVCLITGTIRVGPFLETSAKAWHHLQRNNLDQVFFGLQAVLAPMVEAGTGQVVVFTSATGARPEPGVAAYGATRAGANALVRAVGLEMAPKGVVVNAIGTNFMDFPGFLEASGATDPEVRRKIESRIPARRLGTMTELANFAAVLLDGRTRFQTGQFFSYSGGWST